MGILDDVRQTLTEVTGSVVEKGQNFSTQARLQLAMKKLQMEKTKRIHDLGNRAYSWFISGSMTTVGQVPRDVTELCLQIEDLQGQLDDTERQLEEAKAQAQFGPADAPDVAAVSGPGAPDHTSSPSSPGHTSSSHFSNADDPADSATSPPSSSSSSSRGTQPLG